MCVVAKEESWYQCHAIIRMWAPKGHCVCVNPEELQLSGWFSWSDPVWHEPQLLGHTFKMVYILRGREICGERLGNPVVES